MDNIDRAKWFKEAFSETPKSGKKTSQTTTVFATAMSNSVNGEVLVDFGGDIVSGDGSGYMSIPTAYACLEGDRLIVQLIGEDGTGKNPIVMGVEGRGDEVADNIIEAGKEASDYIDGSGDGVTFGNSSKPTEGNVLTYANGVKLRKGETVLVDANASKLSVNTALEVNGKSVSVAGHTHKATNSWKVVKGSVAYTINANNYSKSTVALSTPTGYTSVCLIGWNTGNSSVTLPTCYVATGGKQISYYLQNSTTKQQKGTAEFWALALPNSYTAS